MIRTYKDLEPHEGATINVGGKTWTLATDSIIGYAGWETEGLAFYATPGYDDWPGIPYELSDDDGNVVTAEEDDPPSDFNDYKERCVRKLAEMLEELEAMSEEQRQFHTEMGQ